LKIWHAIRYTNKEPEIIMNKAKLVKCPPLTPDDILTLRGKPVAKRVEPAADLSKQEEWIYISARTGTEEHYFFRDECLVGWAKQPV